MVLTEIFESLEKCDLLDTSFGISEQMRLQLVRSVPEVDWFKYDSNAYELIRSIGQNVKWKLEYPYTTNYNIILNTVAQLPKAL
jgi:hypothetical protein